MICWSYKDVQRTNSAGKARLGPRRRPSALQNTLVYQRRGFALALAAAGDVAGHIDGASIYLTDEVFLYRVVRSGARYKRTLDLLANAKKWDPATVTKSGVMVGIGEETHELIEVFRDLGKRGVDILTIGQYLRPSKDHLPMTRYYTPAEFLSLKEEALKFGFKHVESGPLVRSSYHAHEQADVAAG